MRGGGENSILSSFSYIYHRKNGTVQEDLNPVSSNFSFLPNYSAGDSNSCPPDKEDGALPNSQLAGRNGLNLVRFYGGRNFDRNMWGQECCGLFPALVLLHLLKCKFGKHAILVQACKDMNLLYNVMTASERVEAHLPTQTPISLLIHPSPYLSTHLPNLAIHLHTQPLISLLSQPSLYLINPSTYLATHLPLQNIIQNFLKFCFGNI